MSDKFKEWALSYSGCDGGDHRQGGTWICGLEFGGGDTEQSLETTIGLGAVPKPVVEHTEEAANQYLKFQYNIGSSPLSVEGKAPESVSEEIRQGAGEHPEPEVVLVA